MNAPVKVKAARSLNDLRDFFVDVCESRAHLFANGVLTLHEAVDEVQAIAVRTGLVEMIGQDEVQEIMVGAAPLAPDLAEACEAEIMLRAGDLVRRWELDDPRDRWRHTGEPPPAAHPRAAPLRVPSAPAQSTIDAFFYLAQQQDAERLSRWLAARPMDAPALYKIWKGSRC
jgi:hypothetical protein